MKCGVMCVQGPRILTASRMFSCREACISTLVSAVGVYLFMQSSCKAKRNAKNKRTARKHRGVGGVLEVRIELNWIEEKKRKEKKKKKKGHVGLWKSQGGIALGTPTLPVSSSL